MAKDYLDKNDFEGLTGNLQQCALLNKNKNVVDLSGHYNGASIFFICNGPSFQNLNQDLLRQDGILTYGINNGVKSFRPNFWSCVDDPSRFMKSIWQDPSICKIVPHAHWKKPLFDNENWEDLYLEDEKGEKRSKIVHDCPNVFYFLRNEKFNADTFLTESTFNWGNHKKYGGGRSVMLPVLRIMYFLGFRNIYLLGADFNMTEESTYHFEEDRHKGAVNNNTKTYNRLENEYFPALKPYFDEVGFKIYNCNPDSKLTIFPHVPYEDAIASVKKETGDRNSKTRGLYARFAEQNKNKKKNKKQNEENLRLKSHLSLDKSKNAGKININDVIENNKKLLNNGSVEIGGKKHNYSIKELKRTDLSKMFQK